MPGCSKRCDTNPTIAWRLRWPVEAASTGATCIRVPAADGPHLEGSLATTYLQT